MLKEVEANGQISLGQQFAGRRYDMHLHDDGRVELLPVPEPEGVKDPAPSSLWVEQNADAIEAYNAWASQREPYAQRVRRWRAAQPL
jgi:hypothetical protein